MVIKKKKKKKSYLYPANPMWHLNCGKTILFQVTQIYSHWRHLERLKWSEYMQYENQTVKFNLKTGVSQVEAHHRNFDEIQN